MTRPVSKTAAENAGQPIERVHPPPLRPVPSEVDGDSAMHINRTLFYVPQIARRYLGRGLSFDELIAAGNLGLVEAALRFDPGRKVQFIPG